MINTAPNHKHTYDEQGRMTCCTLEEKIYTEAGAEQLAGFLHRRGEDSRLEGSWVVEERVVDQLSDEEIAQQWEYNVEDPHTPRLVDPTPSEDK